MHEHGGRLGVTRVVQTRYKVVVVVVVILLLFLEGVGVKISVPVNSYGQVRTVSSPNHTFSWASNQYCVQILSLLTDNNPSGMINGREENERSNLVMINLVLRVRASPVSLCSVLEQEHQF